MKTSTIRTYFRGGCTFLRDHPQLWLTALVGVSIFAAFIFMAFRFATIAQDAQEELVNVRIGSIFDALVLFAPDVIDRPDVLRTRLEQIRAQNETVRYFTILAPHGNDAWRVYVRDDGSGEGSVFTVTDPQEAFLFDRAQADPSHAYTLEHEVGGERRFMTARAILNSAGTLEALAVSEQELSQADQLISDNIRHSTYLLMVILILIMILFFRHARIVDYATLYKKQVEIDEMKDSFISMASHELKSPLSVIRGYIEFLRDDTVQEKDRHEYLHRIDASANELRQLIDDILDVSRIEMGRLRFSPDRVHPAEVVDEVVAMFKDAAAGKGLALVQSVTDGAEHAAVFVDRGRLKQVMVNLVSNAVKYTLAGSITVEVSAENGLVHLAVRDTGVGMTAEEQKKLFGKFYRAEAEETKAVSGTGLGLWITKYIIEHMNGTISVESIKEQGSRFVVIFPLYVAASGAENAKNK